MNIDARKMVNMMRMATRSVSIQGSNTFLRRVSVPTIRSTVAMRCMKERKRRTARMRWWCASSHSSVRQIFWTSSKSNWLLSISWLFSHCRRSSHPSSCINRYKLGMKTVRHPARERHAVMKTPGNPEHSTQNPDTAILINASFLCVYVVL